MPFYLYQWAYKDPAIQAMLETPQDRPAELRKAVQAFGGSLRNSFSPLANTMALRSSSSPTMKAAPRAASRLPALVLTLRCARLCCSPQARAGSDAPGAHGAKQVPSARGIYQPRLIACLPAVAGDPYQRRPPCTLRVSLNLSSAVRRMRTAR